MALNLNQSVNLQVTIKISLDAYVGGMAQLLERRSLGCEFANVGAICILLFW